MDCVSNRMDKTETLNYKAKVVGTKITYQKAPLVELIVEVRWPVKTIPIPGGLPIVNDSSAVFDLWYQQLTGSLQKEGFQSLERLVPHNMPVMAHQPVYRYLMPGKQFPICQFGHGIFTVNAGPPNYKSWESFRPIVLACLNALSNARPEEIKPDEFQGASLRYIDSFGEDLRNGLSNYVFIKDELGVKISMPHKLLDMAKDEKEISPTIALKMPIDVDGKETLAFQVAEGRIGGGGDPSTIMDMVYTVSKTIPMGEGNVMKDLDRGHDILHQWFDTLTEKIADHMEPVVHDNSEVN